MVALAEGGVSTMSLSEWFLFFWVGMALVPFVSMFSVALYCLAKAHKNKQLTFSSGFGFVVYSLIFLVATLMFWPKSLYRKGMRYFSFPTKKDYEIAMDILFG